MKRFWVKLNGDLFAKEIIDAVMEFRSNLLQDLTTIEYKFDTFLSEYLIERLKTTKKTLKLLP